MSVLIATGTLVTDFKVALAAAGFGALALALRVKSDVGRCGETQHV